ncbi:unnamed protein product [Pieris brassicae]|uniref:Uncharacterized protein n=1 Tax=Pieris brassicae TaxID=7116 RepID=A0A9P0TAP3_PIEBR|nr:unnamed protein product [Pieris brassicae]
MLGCKWRWIGLLEGSTASTRVPNTIPGTPPSTKLHSSSCSEVRPTIGKCRRKCHRIQMSKPSCPGDLPLIIPLRTAATSVGQNPGGHISAMDTVAAVVSSGFTLKCSLNLVPR